MIKPSCRYLYLHDLLKLRASKLIRKHAETCANMEQLYPCCVGSGSLRVMGLTGMWQHKQAMELSLCLEVHNQTPLFTDAHASWVERTYDGMGHKSGNVGDQGLLMSGVSSKTKFRFLSSLSILAKGYYQKNSEWSEGQKYSCFVLFCFLTGKAV